MFDEIIDQLAIFEGMDTTQRNLLKSYFDVCECNDEEVIFAQGGSAEYLYVVIEGDVSIHFKPDDGPPLVVSRIQDGGVFGWSAALGRDTYTSCAVCVEGSSAFSVLGEELKQLCEQYPDTGVIILERLAEVIAQRLQKTHANVVEMLQEGVKS